MLNSDMTVRNIRTKNRKYNSKKSKKKKKRGAGYSAFNNGSNNYTKIKDNESFEGIP